MVMKVLAQIESDNTDKIYEIRVGNDCKHLERFMVDGADFIGTVPNNPVTNNQGFVVRAILLD